MARHIERTFELEHGWIDQPHSEEDGASKTEPVHPVAIKLDTDRHQAFAGLLQAVEGFSASELAELQAQADLIRRRKSGGF